MTTAVTVSSLGETLSDCLKNPNKKGKLIRASPKPKCPADGI